MQKKGLSAVVSSVILIALVLFITAIVWLVVSKIVNQETKSAQSCFDIQDKLYLDNANTCYNSTNNKLRFYIGIKDLDIEKILVSIKGNSASKSFEIPGDTHLKLYNNSNTVLPEKNGGLLYIASGLTELGKITTIEIAPVIDEELCQISDSINQIDNCLSLG